jgi:ADP-ribosylglycohydrolase
VTTGSSATAPDLRSRLRGCLLAGAVGDALGAAVEFWTLDQIHARLGPDGVTGYLPAHGCDGGVITDDTQMTLFTAEGIIRATVRYAHRGIAHGPSVLQRAYVRWLATQGEAPLPPAGTDGWLVHIEGLHHRRAPGNTCLAALRGGEVGEVEKPTNQSKGCGGVMRAAPAGLTGLHDPFGLGTMVAAVTHGHVTGYLTAGFLSKTIAGLLAGHDLGRALDDATAELRQHPGHEETLAAVERARTHDGGVEALGAGWVAEEALAIAIHCVLAAPDLRAALLRAVNHSGDSDSTGAIAGNLAGALYGEAAIPPEWLEALELRDVIEQVADDFHDAYHGLGVGGEYEEIDDRLSAFLARYPGY